MLTRIVFRSYALAHLYTVAKLALVRPQAPVLVYTVGKVGSESITRSLQHSGLGRPVFHLHWLTDRRLRANEDLYVHRNRRSNGRPSLPIHVWEGNYWLRRIKESRSSDTNWDIVTLVREPIARNISAFFQNLRLVYSYDYEQELTRKGQDAVVSELLDLFREEYVARPEAMRYDGDPLTWFDEELKPVFGVDVFSAPFSFETGYSIYRGDGVRVLLMRLEDLGACAAKAFEAFLGIKGFRPTPDNVGASKDYGALYRAFLDKVALPEEYMDFVYSSKYSRQFYSPAELAKFRARWSSRRS